VHDPLEGDGDGAAVLQGLTAAEVAERVADGRVNVVPKAPSRTLSQIVRANVLTPINLVIGVMLVLVVVARGIGPDMLFAGVIVSNSVIGIVQEVRARAALGRLAVLTEPRACALRDGARADLAIEQVVADDLLVLAPGWQVVVDGVVESAGGLELNESLLTGESDPVPKQQGDEVLSGSFVSSGHGCYRATRIGSESYAASLAEEARRFTLVDSELRRGVNRILKVLMWLIPPVATLLFWRLLRTGDDWREALSGVVASSVAMVPDGLVLLTSLAFMAGVVTLSRRKALLRELASVELLARVDTLCLDKTGTITTGRIVVSEVVPLDGTDPLPSLAALAGSDPDPNATLRALAAECPDDPGWELEDIVPFSSTRKWSAASFGGDGPGPGRCAVYLGAPEVLLDGAHPDVADRVAGLAGEGHRVVLMATAPSLSGDSPPVDLVPRALVLLSDEIRPDAKETLEYFQAQGVELKVISGDHPETVAAVARRAGVPGAERVLDARELPVDDAGAMGSVVEEHTVFGRVTPRQKRAMVLALQERGRVVAMTGDGVNDVLALKDSDMGIAMGSGSGASRSVAQLVLLEDRFSLLPDVLAEGRRVMNSVERAANLFIYGTVYSVVIAVVIAAMGTEFPFLPRHLTLVRVLSVGIPGIFLALAPDPRRSRSGFLERVVRFSVPAGVIAAVAALLVWAAAYAVADDLIEARTAPTITLLLVGLVILVRLTRPLPPWRWYLVAAMGLLMSLALVVPGVAKFFELALPPAPVWLAIAGAVAAAAIALRMVPDPAEDAVG
jgi:cation-transporting P-type ATPase E